METFGQLGQVLNVVTSLWFGVALIGLGVLYVIFVPSEYHPAIKYPAIGAKISHIFGWATIVIYVLFLWGAIVAGYVATHVPQPRLVVESTNEPMSFLFEKKQAYPPKASKFAQITVTNIGKKSVTNVKATVTKLNIRDCNYQLPLASINILFKLPKSHFVQGTASLNPGDNQRFYALVECNGLVCPKGELAVPVAENGGLEFLNSSYKGAIEKIKSLTIRISGDGIAAVTKTFMVSQGSDGQLLLNPQPSKQLS